MPTRTVRSFDRSLRWLAPCGHLGDALLLSSVVHAGFEKNQVRWGVLRVQPLTSLFIGHPGVAEIAVADAGQAAIQRTDYWNLPFSNHPKSLRPFDRLSLMLFGKVIAEERLWAPELPGDEAALRGLPFTAAPLLVAPGSDSPRKVWPPAMWRELADRLHELTKVPIVQVGPMQTPTIAGTLNVSGTLGIRQLLALIARSQAVVSVDPFVAAAAGMHGIPTLNLFGATSPDYGAYRGQASLCDTGPCAQACLDFDRADSPVTCPKVPHCMTQIGVGLVLEKLREVILPGLTPDRPLLAT